MSDYNAAYVAEIANFIFDDRITPENVNDQVADVASKAFHAALTASKALDLVPRPAAVTPGIAWLMNQAVQAFWRSRGRQRIYSMAQTTARLKWRSAYAMAKAGL